VAQTGLLWPKRVIGAKRLACKREVDSLTIRSSNKRYNETVNLLWT
jgi:hypothetical protein